MANRTVDLLDQSRSPSRTIVLLAMPAIIEQLLQTMVNYVDTAMVGSMGKEATAAVAVTTVSYTHLDVYKRQPRFPAKVFFCPQKRCPRLPGLWPLSE